MAVVDLEYNCISRRCQTKMDGRKVGHLDEKYSGRGRIQGWIADYLMELAELANEPVELRYRGTEPDFEDVTEEAERVAKDIGPARAIRVAPAASGLVRLDMDVVGSNLEALFDRVKDADWLNEDPEFLASIDGLLHRNEFRIAVIATMSSGKSTLLNALLGRRLLPARNEATTAMLTYLHDHDGLQEPEVRAYDSDGSEILMRRPVGLSEMEEVNRLAAPSPDAPDRRRVFRADVNVDIPFIQNLSFGRLVLVDSPGPNNSGDMDHRGVTYRLISPELAESRPDDAADVVLYVMNATQMEVDDDRTLLNSVSEAIRLGGIAAHDRFLFVVNKIDAWDPRTSDGPVDAAVARAKQYLRRFKIENPILIPTDALGALLARCEASGVPLTPRDQADLRHHSYLVTEELDVNAAATCWGPVRREVIARQHGSVNGAAVLVRTGVPMLEECIRYFLAKYWMPLKIQRLVRSFDCQILGREKLVELQQLVLGQQEKVDVHRREIENLRSLLGKSDIPKRLNARFQELRKQQLAHVNPVVGRLQEELLQFAGAAHSGWRESSPESVRGSLVSLQKKCIDAVARAKVEAEKVFDATRAAMVDELKKQFLSDLQQLVDKALLESVPKGAGALVIKGLSLEQLVGEATYSKSEKYTYTAKVKRAWYNPLRWFGSTYTTEEREGTRQVERVDVQALGAGIEKEIAKFIHTLHAEEKAARADGLDGVGKWVERLCQAVDTALRKFADDMERQMADKKAAETVLAESRRRIEEMHRFRAELDAVISAGFTTEEAS